MTIFHVYFQRLTEKYYKITTNICLKIFTKSFSHFFEVSSQFHEYFKEIFSKFLYNLERTNNLTLLQCFFIVSTKIFPQFFQNFLKVFVRFNIFWILHKIIPKCLKNFLKIWVIFPNSNPKICPKITINFFLFFQYFPEIISKFLRILTMLLQNYPQFFKNFLIIPP